jgi:chaperonin cofactor prefoldin|tara:strand:- start:591 stop:809 length:219 start_codon:yes stop_codon:yes gene_type:complete
MSYSYEERIKQLEENLEMEKQVKKSEVQLNADLKKEIEKRDLHIETLVKINEQYSDKIAKLRMTLKKWVNEI